MTAALLSRYEDREICQTGLLSGTKDANVTIQGINVDYQMNPPIFTQWYFKTGDTPASGTQYTINIKFAKSVMV